jgi:hypothetical protein
MKKILVSVIIASAVIACKTPKETAATPKPDCSNSTVTYATDIKPIMEANCTKCHNKNNKAGYNFFTLESVKEAASKGELLGTIKHLKGYAAMPKMASKMDQATIDKIECWINNGMR